MARADERDTNPTQEIDGDTTAHETDKPPAREEELSVLPEDLPRHLLENATEAEATAPEKTE
jgi:hypothetical protein